MIFLRLFMQKVTAIDLSIIIVNSHCLTPTHNNVECLTFSKLRQSLILSLFLTWNYALVKEQRTIIKAIEVNFIGNCFTLKQMTGINAVKNLVPQEDMRFFLTQ